MSFNSGSCKRIENISGRCECWSTITSARHLMTGACTGSSSTVRYTCEIRKWGLGILIPIRSEYAGPDPGAAPAGWSIYCARRFCAIAWHRDRPPRRCCPGGPRDHLPGLFHGAAAGGGIGRRVIFDVRVLCETHIHFCTHRYALMGKQGIGLG